jgi:tRNA-modifying protein YgfZ
MVSSPPDVWGFKRRAWPMISVSGPDHIDFLQRLSTQNVKTLNVGGVVPSAFLNGNGTVVGLFLMWKTPDSISLLPEPQSASVILQHLHKMHFAENLELHEEKADWLEIRGRKAREFLKKELSVEPEPKLNWPRMALTEKSTVLPAEPWGSPGWLIKTDTMLAGLPILSEEEYYFERALNLFPRDQIDVSENNIILEAGLLDYVHRDKGCYPGQEVVERIFTYGNVAKKLVLLEGHARELERGSELYTNEKKIGNVTSRHSVSKSGSYFYVATVFRLQAVVGNIFSLGAGQAPQLKVLKVAGTA